MLKYIIYSITCACSFLIVSCSKEIENKEVNSSRETCLQFVEKSNDLTLFKAALDRIELAKDPVYLQNGPYTFFAPDDAAFKKAGLTLQSISNYDKEALKKIVYGHVLTGRVGGGAAGGFYSINARCLDNGYSPVLSRNYYGLFLNGNGSISSTDLGDGLVHKLGSIAFPGTETTWALISRRPDLSMFVQLVEQTSNAGLPYILNFREILSGTEGKDGWINVTAIIPDNDAFARLGYNTPEDFDRLMVTEKFSLLLAHLSNGYSFTSDFIQKDQLIPGTDVLRMGNSTILPRLLEVNIKASNGVYHIIDQVIFVR